MNATNGNTGLIKLLFSRKEAAYSLSLSIRALDYLIEAGFIEVRRIGSRVLIPIEEVHRVAREGHQDSVMAA